MRANKERKEMDFHGFSGTELYHRWTSIVSRVTDPDNACYKTYGGRGIKICNEWRDFLNFQEWALNHGFDRKLIIDRIDVDGNYCPENCRWVTKSESSINKRKGNDFNIQCHYKRYQVTIVRKGWHYYLGTFSNIGDAKKARDKFIKFYDLGGVGDYKSAILCFSRMRIDRNHFMVMVNIGSHYLNLKYFFKNFEKIYSMKTIRNTIRELNQDHRTE
jgi:hypothetical protein